MKTCTLFGITYVALSAAAVPVAAQQPALAFRDVTVIDVTDGRRLPDQTVLIVGNRIQAVGPSRTVRLPKGAKVVDARGRYLIPGLWDLHTHSRRAAHLFYPLFIAHGVTGMRDAWSEVPLDTLVHWWREILAGTRVGPPRQMLSGPHPGRVDLNDSEIASRKALGANFLKVYPFSFRAAAAARRAGMPFGGHLEGVSAIQASDSGMVIIDHVNNSGGFIRLCWGEAGSDEQCQPVVERFTHNGTWLVPTLTRLAIQGMSSGANERQTGRSARSRPVLERFHERVRAFWAGSPLLAGNWLRDSLYTGTILLPSADSIGTMRIVERVGLPILAGTDAGSPVLQTLPPGFSLHAELAMYVAEGLTPLHALQTATLNPARMLHATDSLGTVARGKLADLVLLEADPLADITNTTTIRAVVANGRYYDRAALDQLLTEVQAEGNRVADAATPAPRVIADTTQPVLTSEEVARLLAFLRAAIPEWSKPDVNRFFQTHQVLYPIAVGHIGGPIPEEFQGALTAVPDMQALADTFPTINQLLTASQLTAGRYMQLQRAVLCASVTDQLDRMAHNGTATITDTSTVIGKNVAFLRANPGVEPDLRYAGLELVTLRPQGTP